MTHELYSDEIHEGFSHDETPTSASVARTREQLRSIDSKVNSMRSRIKNDPDDAFDKLIKFALPTIAGLIIGKLTEFAWKSGKKRILGDKAVDDEGNDLTDGIIASMIFAALSAAIGSLVSNLADRSSAGIVNLRHKRAARKSGKHAR
ncbi:DUF4235 domain-containing protein [Alloscardovia theropitheci]|nr:DUF4235 domain-containing protein [Alloscardovia theropitheci]